MVLFKSQHEKFLRSSRALPTPAHRRWPSRSAHGAARLGTKSKGDGQRRPGSAPGALSHQGAARQAQMGVPPAPVFLLLFLESAAFFSWALETGELGRAGDCFGFPGSPPATDPRLARGGERSP